MTSPSVNASYAYNGMGDRLQQVHNGGTTNFMMDYNTGLTQALSDGTNTYIYGNGRIAQTQGSTTEYFLGDALGSVRQLTNTSGAITYASAYDPYGVTTQTYGTAQTAYGYTNEYTSQGLVYLRARMYSSGMGRFLTRDTWEGNPNHPITFNRWAYTKDNPINLTDPSGWLTPDEETKANEIVERLARIYGVNIKKDWGWGWGTHFDFNPCNDIPFSTKVVGWSEGAWRNLDELKLTRDAIKKMATTLGGPDKFKSAMKGHPVDIKRYTDYSNWAGFAPHPAIDQFFGEVMLFNGAFNYSEERAKGYVVHELAHVWDFRNGFQLSDGLADLVDPYFAACVLEYCTVVWDPDSAIQHFPTNYAKENAREFWADVFKVYLFPSLASLNPLSPMVENYVQQKIIAIP